MEQKTSKYLEMITIQEASDRTGVSYDCLRKLCLNNQVVHIRAGKKYLINWEKLVKYLETGRQQ